MGRLIGIVLAILTLTGCIPTTRATIAVGFGYDVAGMRRAESTVEGIGFVRQYYEKRSGEKSQTYAYEGSLMSSYQGPCEGLGAAVVWRESDGRLLVEFAERDTSFSSRGRETLQRLVADLRKQFGEAVAVSDNGLRQ
jgi:hypothetical protein